MLIDKIPTNYWDSQVLLKPNQYPEQHTMVQQIGVLLHDKYQVTVQRFYELAPKDGMVVHHTATRSDLQNTMGTDLHLHQVFENSTAELPPTPYLGVWKSDGPHPEYVAVGMLYLSPPNNHSTLLGYFELEPK